MSITKISAAVCLFAVSTLVQADNHETAMQAGDLPLRMLLVPFEPSVRKRFGDDVMGFYSSMAERATDRLAVHGVKYVNDGSYPSMTLRLNFPGYLDIVRIFSDRSE